MFSYISHITFFIKYTFEKIMHFSKQFSWKSVDFKQHKNAFFKHTEGNMGESFVFSASALSAVVGGSDSEHVSSLWIFFCEHFAQTWALRDLKSTAFLTGSRTELVFMLGCILCRWSKRTSLLHLSWDNVCNTHFRQKDYIPGHMMEFRTGFQISVTDSIPLCASSCFSFNTVFPSAWPVPSLF